MNSKLIEEKFNILYEEINKKYYDSLNRLKEEAKKEDNIRHLMWLIYVAIVIFLLYFMSIIDDNLSMIVSAISILFIIVFFIGCPIFITFYFNKKSDNYYKIRRETVLKDIIENVNDNWEYYNTNRNYFWKRNMTDYFDAKFPNEPGGLLSSYGIKNKINGNILESMFFEIYEGGEEGRMTTYRGIYFSILNKNCIENDIYIRSKTYDGLFKGKLPFSKLDVNTSNYNIYSENIYAIPNGLIELIDKFYELTDIHCDLSIRKNKIQIRFNINVDNIFKTEIKTELFNRKLLYETYFELVEINEFIKELCTLLSN